MALPGLASRLSRQPLLSGQTVIRLRLVGGPHLGKRSFCSGVSPPKPSGTTPSVSPSPTTPQPDRDTAAAAAAAAAAPTAPASATLRATPWGKFGEMVVAEKSTLALGMGGLIVSSAVNLAFPMCMGQMIDAIMGSPGAAMDLDSLVLTLSGVFVAGGVAGFVRVYAFTAACGRMDRALRSRLYRSVLSQRTAFFDTAKSGELMSRLTVDTEVVAKMLTVNMSASLRSLSSSVGGTGMLLYLSPQLTGAAVAVLPLMGVTAAVYGRYSKRISAELQSAMAAATDTAQEKLAGIRTVRLFGRERYEAGRYEARLADSYGAMLKSARAEGVFMGSIGFGVNMSLLAVLYCGGSMVTSGALTIGELSSFTMYSMTVALGYSGLSSGYGDLMKASGAGQRVFDLLDEDCRTPAQRLEDQINSKASFDSPAASSTTTSTATATAHSASASAELPDRLGGSVSFENVHFAYPTRADAPILRGLTLTMPEGSVTAVVGSSGSGKSTLAALLTKLYEPDSGQVLIDGAGVAGMDADWLRQHIGVVSQEPELFSGTVADAIRYGDLCATDKQVEAAARKAHAHGFIASLPDGYNTQVGQRGASLSGGQKQRVAIARAILRDPEILILDEATSALDSESERLVQRSLNEVFKGRTVMVIAHRLSTIAQADAVAVLQEGEVVEIGAYDDLVNTRGGVFQQLVETQLLTTTEDQRSGTEHPSAAA